METSKEQKNVSVNDLIADIKANLKQKSASKRDEVLVMRAMLNDKTFEVKDYATEETHCPAQDFRTMMSNVVSASTKMGKSEAEALVNDYEVKKSDAETMVQLSKDFFNTSLRTGRKINLGANENSNISIQLKEIPASVKKFPIKVGMDDNGNPIYDKKESVIPAHEGLKVTAPCPSWKVKK